MRYIVKDRPPDTQTNSYDGTFVLDKMGAWTGNHSLARKFLTIKGAKRAAAKSFASMNFFVEVIK
jgi:hypothetical protein